MRLLKLVQLLLLIFACTGSALMFAQSRIQARAEAGYKRGW